MARTAQTTKTTKPAAPARKPGRSAAAPAKAAAKASKPAPASKRMPVAAAPVAKPSKDELRAQVEKLEATVATLRMKSREANRAAKTAAARIAELEDQVAQLEAKLASQTASAARVAKGTTPSRGKRKSRDLDPGDAVPPGVAVQEPALPDLEAETARANLEDHLQGE